VNKLDLDLLLEPRTQNAGHEITLDIVVFQIQWEIRTICGSWEERTYQSPERLVDRVHHLGQLFVRPSIHSFTTASLVLAIPQIDLSSNPNMNEPKFLT